MAEQSVHDFELKTIDGKAQPLSEYAGKVLLIVNVASKCGFTPQYEGLEKLHEKYQDRGVVVMGVPANEFGAQEPGSDAQIQSFCTSNYGVRFPMFSKIVVKGEGQHPLYSLLTSEKGDVTWNFNKFLVGKKGEVLARFESKVAPDGDELEAAIEAALEG